MTHLKRIPIAAYALGLFILGHLIFVLSKWHHVPMDAGLPTGQTDPDTWLRLTLVRDWIMGGGWYDHLVHRSNAPFAPVPSPWTRPLDLVLAALAWAQPHDTDLSLRLIRAGLLAPVLWMGLLVAGMMRCMRVLMPIPSAAVMVALLAITLQPMWNYFSLGNADHHAPLAALFVWIIGGVLTERPSARLMFVTGLLFGLQLWISVEAMILIALVYAWYGASWLMGNRDSMRALCWLAFGAALMAFAAILIERPPSAWLTPIPDSISIMQAATLGFCCLYALMLNLSPARTLPERAVTALFGLSLLVLAIASTYPQLFAGPMAGVDPFIRTDFLPRISEARPAYKMRHLLLFAFIMLPVAGLTLNALSLIKRECRFLAPHHSRALAFFLTATLILYFCQQRWNYYLLPLSIIAVAPLLAALFTPEHPLVRGHWPANLLATLPENEQMQRRLPLALMLFAFPVLLMLANNHREKIADFFHQPRSNTDAADDERFAARDTCYETARELIRSGALVKAMPKGEHTLLLPTDLGTEILFFTPYRIVASNYHREGTGVKYVWDAEKITREHTLRTTLAARHIDTLLLCPNIEPVEGNLFGAYIDGKKLPAWLDKIPYPLPQPAAESAKDAAGKTPPLLLQVRHAP